MRTDWYKPVMAMAGASLRPETFNFAIRKGGPFFMPVDPVAYVKGLLTKLDPDDEAYLQAHGLGLGGAYRAAMMSDVEIHGLPKGCWFSDREVILTVTGPSALVSHLEAQVIWLRFRIQVATLAKQAPERLAEALGIATCEREREIILESLDGAGVNLNFSIDIDTEGYAKHIQKRARLLIDVLDDPGRAFEAGMRAASCAEQHLIAVEAIRDAGFKTTSNIEAARALNMTPGGTTGHEHTQRYGGDWEAFTAIRDRMAGEVTFLLDTYSTRFSGLPMALRVMRQTPSRACSIRFDSENTMEGDYLLGVHAMREAGLEAPIHLGGGFTLERTKRFETLRAQVDWPSNKQRYMYGQYLVEPHVPLPTRGDVGAVYKLSQSGDSPTIKFSDTADKSSSPGIPVVWRLMSPGRADRGTRPIGIIGQLGERAPEDYAVLTDGRPMHTPPEMLTGATPERSTSTQAMMDSLNQNRLATIAQAAQTTI
jgi:nicotinic acid phosphoribosyltransferase